MVKRLMQWFGRIITILLRRDSTDKEKSTNKKDNDEAKQPSDEVYPLF